MEEAIREVAEELNFPSAAKLKKVLESRGIKASTKEINAVVQGQSVRQVQAPAYRFNGKIASHELNDRWFADLIDFTAAPSDGGRKTSLRPTKDGERYVLVVQDVFSRKLYTKALLDKRPETVSGGFEQILADAGVKPNSVTSDLGAEFGTPFKRLLESKGIESYQKQKADINAIATIDTAIGNLKKAMARDARKNQTNDWADRLQKVTAGQNELPNDEYLEGSAPNVVADNTDLRQLLREKNAEFSEHNRARAEKREKALTDKGQFRVAESTGAFTRSFKPKWSSEVHAVKSVDHAKVTDTAGNEYLTKFTQPISGADDQNEPVNIERGGSKQTDNKKRKHLQPWAETAVKYIDGTDTKTMSLQRLGKMFKDQPDFRLACLESGISMTTPLANFLRVFPEFFVVDGTHGIVRLQPSASTRPTETLAPFFRRLRRIKDSAVR